MILKESLAELARKSDDLIYLSTQISKTAYNEGKSEAGNALSKYASILSGSEHLLELAMRSSLQGHPEEPPQSDPDYLAEFQQAAQKVMSEGWKMQAENPYQYLTWDVMKELGIAEDQIQEYLDMQVLSSTQRSEWKDQGEFWTGHDCHFQYTKNPTGNINWCLYFVIEMYRRAGWQIAKNNQQAYKIAATNTFIEFLYSKDCPESWKVWKYEEYAKDPSICEPGDILILKAHGCVITSFDSDWRAKVGDRSGRYITIEGNILDQETGIRCIRADYWSRDDRSSQLLYVVRPLQPNV